MSVRESTIQLVNYVMILALLVTLAIHLAQQAFVGVSSYSQAISFGVSFARYGEPLGAGLLTILLVAASFHGLWGMRAILLELRPGPVWIRIVNLTVISLGLVMLGWGMRTIVVTGGM